jgi:citrate lyase subunit beta/citryl-CoA lyase
MTIRQPVWRSLQYVPTHVEKFVAAAHTRGADALILDLEDSVPWDQKARARNLLPNAAASVGQAGADVIVRINADPALAQEDIAAAIGPKVYGLSLPKAETPDQIRRIDEAVGEAERRAGVEEGATRFILIVESAAGFLNMSAVATASPRTVAISLGAEDFALDLGMEPNDETLLAPKQQVVIVAAAAGVMPLGLVGGATGFDDPDAYLALAQRSRRFGYVGATCIHPKQVPLLNAAFAPGEAEVAHARRVVEANKAAAAEGRGAFAVDGKMVDAPIVARAEALLARHAAIQARTANLHSKS